VSQAILPLRTFTTRNPHAIDVIDSMLTVLASPLLHVWRWRLCRMVEGQGTDCRVAQRSARLIEAGTWNRVNCWHPRVDALPVRLKTGIKIAKCNVVFAEDTVEAVSKGGEVDRQHQPRWWSRQG
jgi:hypothetical protein